MKTPLFSSRITLIIVVVCLSLLSGLVGGTLAENYYLSIAQDLNPTSILDRSKIRTSEQKSAEELLSNIAPSMLGIYSAKKDKNAGLVEQLFVAKEFKGFATAVTRDGWLITPSATITGTTSDFILVDREKHTYSIDKKIEDAQVGLIFLHIASQELKPASLVSQNEVMGPQQAYIINDFSTIKPFSVTALGYKQIQNTQDYIQTPDKLSKLYNYGETFGVIGQPIINDKEEIMGLTSSTGVIPSPYIYRALAVVLKQGAPKHPTLPLTYLDSAWLAHVPLDQALPSSNGALVLDDKKGPYLPTSTGKLVLSQGDVIVSINGELIDQNRSLSELISQYQTDDVVTLQLQKKGVLSSYKVTIQ